eukprot:1572586-Alexandrium_andersonii.AAC.1
MCIRDSQSVAVPLEEGPVVEPHAPRFLTHFLGIPESDHGGELLIVPREFIGGSAAPTALRGTSGLWR